MKTRKNHFWQQSIPESTIGNPYEQINQSGFIAKSKAQGAVAKRCGYAIGSRHDLRIFDDKSGLESRFNNIDAVIEVGGLRGTRRMADISSTIKLWQILGRGFDHFDLAYWKEKKIPVTNCTGGIYWHFVGEMATMFILLLACLYDQSKQVSRGTSFIYLWERNWKIVASLGGFRGQCPPADP